MYHNSLQNPHFLIKLLICFKNKLKSWTDRWGVLFVVGALKDYFVTDGFFAAYYFCSAAQLAGALLFSIHLFHICCSSGKRQKDLKANQPLWLPCHLSIHNDLTTFCDTVFFSNIGYIGECSKDNTLLYPSCASCCLIQMLLSWLWLEK